MASQVAAIDRRNVARQQWSKRSSIVPIEEMASILLQLRERTKSILGPFNKSIDGAIAEVICCQIRQQGHSDVGRAGTRRDHLVRVHMHVVWWQPVVVRVHKHFEVTPCPTSHVSKE